MNRDDITRMAREAGGRFHGPNIEHLSISEEDFLSKLAPALLAAGAAAEREKVAQWMMQRGYATGHGDTIEDLLVELDWQILEGWNRALINGVKTEREECAKVCEEWGAFNKIAAECAEAIRERGQE